MLLVARRRANPTTPNTDRMMSEEFATHSPTAGTKKDTAPETVVMKANAAVLDLNILFMVLLFSLDYLKMIPFGSSVSGVILVPPTPAFAAMIPPLSTAKSVAPSTPATFLASTLIAPR